MKGNNVIVIIEGCVIAHNKDGIISSGSAIIVIGSVKMVKISLCQYFNNTANNGGAVAINCKDYNIISIYLNNSFNNSDRSTDE